MQSGRARVTGHIWRYLSLATALVVAVAAAPIADAAQRAPTAANDGESASGIPIPTARSVAAFAADVPADPSTAAAMLVARVYGDATTSSDAVAEILRRSGIPIVSPDGPVVALPDDLVLVDAATYDGSVADIAASVRAGDGWALGDFIEGLKGFEAIEDFVQPGHIAAAMGSLGKGATDPMEVRFAGSVLRALSGHRGEVLFPESTYDQLVDPLQWLILLAMWTSDADQVKTVAALRPAGVGVRQASIQVAADPCSGLANQLKGPSATVDKDVAKELVKTEIKKYVPKSAGNPIGKGFDVWDKGTSVLSLLILLVGMDLDLSSDKSSTHFKHQAGDRSRHVHLKAVATFDSALAQNRLGCYKLAGISVRPNGPQPGFRVIWDLDQPIGSYSRYGNGPNPYPLFQQGLLLAPISSDSRKIGRLGARGTAGEVTGTNGTSTLELHPPVEKFPGQGAELFGDVRVKASLTQDDMPRLLKVTDPLSIVKEAQGGLPIIWALKKTIDLAISYLNRAGLPQRQTTIKVGYHGPDIYVIKGSDKAYLFFYEAPYSVDLYTCDGLGITGNAAGQTSGGRWRGSATFGNDRIVDPTIINALLRQAAEMFRVPITDLPQIPKKVDFRNDNIDQSIDLLRDPSVPSLIHLISPHVDGWMSLTNPPSAGTVQGPNGTVLSRQHIDGPVGDIELFIGASSLDQLGLLFGGWWSAKFPIVGKSQDSRCPGGPDDYYFERI